MAASVVYIVGAGPGDPDLLTIRALRVIEQAEVVVYDRLLSQGILDLIPVGAARIYAGKAVNRHAYPQAETNALLARLALAGHRVVRLKGGDPLIFGRGSEEAAYLAARGVRCEFVPGITAAVGCAAGVGIPLTHRGLATGVRFVTGHCRNDQPLDLNWGSLADPDTTLVIYMGLAHIGQICRCLVDAGLAADTPAAAIASGTMPAQRVVVGSIADLPDRVSQADLAPPVLFVVGRVVALAAGAEEVEQPSPEARLTEILAGHG